ncbi:branched-chain amino acid transport system II carrier protein [Rickettsiales endosymbiont of Stachyamoeba lipophora]|uniref:branched-chain amino acid transport system II carrier protein n=1 Tax=Rickettsiales endosymbiont of Stachyamoeba lipophora TaxID=2486578 RepID=UPI000F64E6BB|nr:branched-chain amino acid transport system II carrier protein [Rickettsiales endosymbiont of Stachyamoeba lipophora]AZL16156.1 hypothetical protein EF513_06380 [Rickettsiales endosymbiont of Stachyamoeba lipophora]
MLIIYKSIVVDTTIEMILPTIAGHLMGWATILISIILILSCFTTAVALNNIYARYLTEILRLRENVFPVILLVTTSIACFMFLLDFQGIAGFFGPCLELLYPGLIVLTILLILVKGHTRFKAIIFYVIVAFMAYRKYF